MRPLDRKETEVRRMLADFRPVVPPDLAARAAEQGARLLRRRHRAHATLWVFAVLAAILFAVWAVKVQPWQMPAPTPPPVAPPS